jgi:hypothetical protein
METTKMTLTQTLKTGYDEPDAAAVSCYSCRYWHRVSNLDEADQRGQILGQCRRNAPAVGDTSMRWPDAWSKEWCGEYWVLEELEGERR